MAAFCSSIILQTRFHRISTANTRPRPLLNSSTIASTWQYTWNTYSNVLWFTGSAHPKNLFLAPSQTEALSKLYFCDIIVAIPTTFKWFTYPFFGSSSSSLNGNAHVKLSIAPSLSSDALTVYAFELWFSATNVIRAFVQYTCIIRSANPSWDPLKSYKVSLPWFSE